MKKPLIENIDILLIPDYLSETIKGFIATQAIGFFILKRVYELVL